MVSIGSRFSSRSKSYTGLGGSFVTEYHSTHEACNWESGILNEYVVSYYLGDRRDGQDGEAVMEIIAKVGGSLKWMVDQTGAGIGPMCKT